MGSPSQVAGLKRHFCTAAKAASSNSFPPDRLTFKSCGLPCVSTTNAKSTEEPLPSAPVGKPGSGLRVGTGCADVPEQRPRSIAPGGGLNREESGDGSAE